MRKCLSSFVLCILCFSALNAFAQRPFITVWKSDNTGGITGNNQIRLPFVGNYSYTWEEVSNPSNSGSGTGVFHTIVTFPTPGTYRLYTTPTGANPFGQVIFGGAGDCTKIIDVEQWGDIRWSALRQAFTGATNLIHITASDVPDLSGLVLTDLRLMFENSGITTVNNINRWNMSTVTDLDQMFARCPNFNSPIGDWDVSNVTRFTNVFLGAFSFNQPIGDWNVSNGTRFDGMFFSATSFNQPLNTWRFSATKPVALNGLFFDAISFNQPLNDWNTAMVYRMGAMFRAGSERHAFNQDLSNWDLGALDPSDANSFGYIFSNASMDCVNFSNTLESWASKANTPNGLFLGTTDGNEYGPTGQAALDYLVNTKGWNNLGGATYNASCATLPVKLISFAAGKSETQVKLTWSTSSETNSDYFEIQRSADGRNWENLGHVASTGESETLRIYNFTDASPVTVINYYRLKMVDLDGTFAYSQIRSVRFDGHDQPMVLYPNPVVDGRLMINLPKSETYRAEVTSVAGVVVLKQNLAQASELNVSKLGVGVYLLRITSTSGDVQTRAFIVR